MYMPVPEADARWKAMVRVILQNTAAHGVVSGNGGHALRVRLLPPLVAPHLAAMGTDLRHRMAACHQTGVADEGWLAVQPQLQACNDKQDQSELTPV